jgi:hypothetical protein
MTAAVDVRPVQRRTRFPLVIRLILGGIAVMTFAVSGIVAVEMTGSTGSADQCVMAPSVGSLRCSWPRR